MRCVLHDWHRLRPVFQRLANKARFTGIHHWWVYVAVFTSQTWAVLLATTDITLHWHLKIVFPGVSALLQLQVYAPAQNCLKNVGRRVAWANARPTLVLLNPANRRSLCWTIPGICACRTPNITPIESSTIITVIKQLKNQHAIDSSFSVILHTRCGYAGARFRYGLSYVGHEMRYQETVWKNTFTYKYKDNSVRSFHDILSSNSKKKMG